MTELPTSPGSPATLLTESADRLRRRARHLRAAHTELTGRLDEMAWRGAGATRFRRLIHKDLVQLDHCATRVGRAATILDGLADEARQDARRIERQADEVRAVAATWPGGQDAFLRHYGLTALPPDGDPRWSKLWRRVFEDDKPPVPSSSRRP